MRGHINSYSHQASPTVSALTRTGWPHAIATLAAIGTLLFGTSCSLLYDLKTDQCQSTSDCRALGGAFTGLVCVDHLCVEPDPNDTDTTEPLETTEPVDPPDAAADQDGGDGGTTSPEAGPLPGQPCTSHKQCIEEHFDQPHICRDGECISLYSKECPVVLQPENLLVPEPIVVGAYSYINPLNKEGSPITRTYKLAMEEFEDEVGGLTGGPNNTRRKFVTLVCEGADLASAPLENSLAHLVDTVQVPAIVASLFPDSLRDAFDARGKSDNVFFISPLAADSSLTNTDNDGLLWFMLGAYRDLAPVMVALTARAEQFQQTATGGGEMTRVALIEGSLAPAEDIGQVLLSDPDNSLVFNGKPALSNDDNDFLFLKLTSDFEDDEAKATEVIAALSDFRPHIVVVTGGTEFTSKVMPVLEATWDDVAPDQVKPFYVFGPLLAVDELLVKPANSDVATRLAGVNFSRAEDPKLYNMLRANYLAAYPGEPFYDTENFYDSIYYLNYAIAGAGNPARLGGEDIAAGMQRLVSRTGMAMPVGPSNISDVLATLASPNSRINLTGALGPADFNLGTGSRVAKGSVWCVDQSATFQYDVLRPDADDPTSLVGTFPCFDEF